VKSKENYIITTLFLLFIFLSLVLLNRINRISSVAGTSTSNAAQAPEKYHLACPFSEDIYQFQEDNSQLVIKKTKTQAVIIPHHLLAKNLINEALGKIVNDYDNIIIIGPNHFNSGKENIQTSDLNWKTKFGSINADQALIKTLINSHLADLDTDNFNSEHSVCGLVSFIKIHFPESKITPMILKANVSKEQAANLGEFLSQNCDNCLLITSIDFSHDVSQKQTEINDARSIKILQNLDEESLDQVVSDSLPVLQVLFSYLQEKEVNKGKLITNSNSVKIIGKNLSSVTSYITMLFTK